MLIIDVFWTFPIIMAPVYDVIEDSMFVEGNAQLEKDLLVEPTEVDETYNLVLYLHIYNSIVSIVINSHTFIIFLTHVIPFYSFLQ
jgi:hypothetical protein